MKKILCLLILCISFCALGEDSLPSPKEKLPELYVISLLELDSLTQEELFSSSSKNLLEGVIPYWKKYLSENLSKNVSNVFFEEAKTGSSSQDFFSLRLKMTLSKVSENFSLGEREFLLKGEYTLFDNASQNLISSVQLEQKRIKILVREKNALSELGNFLYRYPLSDFSSISSMLEKKKIKLQQFILEIQNVDSIFELRKVSSFLEEAGKSILLKAQISSLENTKGILMVRSSSKNSLIDFLKKMDLKKISETKSLEVDASKEFGLILKNDGENK